MRLPPMCIRQNQIRDMQGGRGIQVHQDGSIRLELSGYLGFGGEKLVFILIRVYQVSGQVFRSLTDLVVLAI
ncbi:hypothetical protein D3C84_1152340 [compost metagenome]